jgi:hypothetical protein
MSVAPWSNDSVIRYVINSKDRSAPFIGNPVEPVVGPAVTGTPANYQIVLKNPINVPTGELWMKLSNFAMSATPYGANKAPTAGAARHGFDTKAYVDLCVDFGGFPLTMDTEQGQAEKTSSDRSLARIPVCRTESDNVCRLWSDYPWVKVRNPGNLGTFGVRVFSDLGLYLSGKNLSSAATADVPDQATTAPVGGNSGPVQQLTLIFAAGPAVFRGNEIYVGSTTPALQITNFIYGPISVLSTAGATVTIGLTSQVVPVLATGTLVSFRTGSKQTPLDDWSMELLVTSSDPSKSRPV